ncbi:MAG: DUF4097 domain-containing protein [Candidatus Aminicenantes bacterium]|nr:DUF4097 domain-containing protein [Candidatus Aminicenantes bacterium]
MKAQRMISAMIAAFGLMALGGLAQTPTPDKVTVPLTNPAKPAVIEANIMFGTMKVIGYEGKEVLVTATPREKVLGGPVVVGEAVRDALRDTLRDIPRPPRVVVPFGRATGAKENEEQEKADKAKKEGMKQIPLESSGLTIEENDNKVEIRLQSWRRAYDLEIRVPSGSSLDLGGANLDEIRVENVSGAVEVSSTTGRLKFINVSGPVTASTTNGDIEAVLTRVAADKPMSFATFNGDLDLTLPSDAKASFRIKSNMGQLYTDFDIALKTLPAEPEKTTGRDQARFRVSLERAVAGSINGGGPEIKLQNFNGDIYLRKKK